MKTFCALLLSWATGMWSLQAAPWTVRKSQPQPAPAALVFREIMVSNGSGTATLEVITFDPKTHTLAVMDNPAGQYTLATAAQKRGVLAAVNGGYFQPDRQPMGLLVRQGQVIHPLEHGRLLSGLVSAANGRLTLSRTGEFTLSKTVREALQAGPFLIDKGQPVAGLEATRTAARTVVFAAADGRFGLLVCRAVTLAEMAEILAAPGMANPGKITRALNLDGGSSSGLWVQGDPPWYLSEGKEVRDYLGVVAKGKQ